MTVESFKTIFDWVAVILLFLTFAAGLGGLIAGKVINKRQEAQLRQFDADLTYAKIELGRQQERAADAESRVGGLETEVANAKAEMAIQQTRAANAEKSLLELKERIRPRRLTDQQSLNFVKALKRLPGNAIKFGYTAGGGDEGFDFLKQLLPLFAEAGWKVPTDMREVSNHLDIQVIGIGILIPNPQNSDRTKLLPPGQIKLDPLSKILTDAFSAVGMQVQFINWYSTQDGMPELVIGSKPNPAN